MTIMLTAAATGAVLWVAGGVSSPARSAAEERAPAFGSADAAGWAAMAAAHAQGGDEEANPDGDDRLRVQLWTLVAAGGAAGVGLLAFVLRLALGWVKPPPAQEESQH